MDKIRRIERLFMILTFSITGLFVILLTFAKFPDWWSYIIFESTPMTWYESILLFACSLFAMLCCMFAFFNDEKKQVKLWGMLGLFFIFLTLDERFAIHERIRSLFLAPKGIKNPIFFWTGAGDFVLITIFVASLILLPAYIKLFKTRKISLKLFIVGILISGIAIVMDSIDVKGYSIELQRLQQYIEEIFETTGMLFFLNSLLLMFTYRLRHFKNIE